MATAKLTERQKEIKALLDKGQTPDQAAKRLKISTNAIYQQVRRMRASGVKIELPGSTGSTAAAKPKTAAKSRRQSGGQSRRTAQRAARPAPAPKPQTAEDILTAEVATTKASIEAEAARITEAQGVIAEAQASIVTLETELARREDVLAVLKGEKVAHAKPAPKPAAKAAKTRAQETAERKAKAEAAAGQAQAAATPQNGSQAAQAGDEPLTQAQREASGEFEPERAEAEAASAAAEAPQPEAAVA